MRIRQDYSDWAGAIHELPLGYFSRVPFVGAVREPPLRLRFTPPSFFPSLTLVNNVSYSCHDFTYASQQRSTRSPRPRRKKGDYPGYAEVQQGREKIRGIVSPIPMTSLFENFTLILTKS
jgi:hypothetical protein